MINKLRKTLAMVLCLVMVLGSVIGIEFGSAAPAYAAGPVKLVIDPTKIENNKPFVNDPVDSWPHEPWGVVDTDPNPETNYWIAFDTGPGALKMDLQKTYCISRWDLRNEGIIPQLIMRDYQLETGTSFTGPWTPVSYVTNNHAVTTSTNLSTTKAARFLRINVTKTGQSDAIIQSPCIADLGIYATNPEVESVVATPKVYKAGENLDITVTYKADLDASDASKIKLPMTIGTNSVNASYLSGAGTTKLVFRYTVQSTDSDLDGVALGNLLLNGTTLKDYANNDAVTTLGTSTLAGVQIDAANMAPTIQTGAQATFLVTDENTASTPKGVSSVLTEASWADANTTPLSGIAVTTVTGNGNWQYSTDGSVWTNFGMVSDTSSLLLGSTHQIRYQPDGKNGDTGSFGYRAWDQTSGTASVTGTPQTANSTVFGGSTAFSTGLATAKITVSAVNDAPVLTPVAPTLTSLLANHITNGGQLVSDVVGSSIADVDVAAVEGLAVTGTANGNGSWQYSIDNGNQWTAIGSVSNTNALLLRAVDKIRFVPNGQDATTASLTYRAWDQSLGSFGQKASAAVNGGTSAFSTATDTATLTVTSRNHTVAVSALTGGTVTGGGSLSEGSSVTITATPNLGYHFVKWTENGTQVSTDASYVFTLGTADRSFIAHFEADVPQCTITFDKNGGDTEATPKTISTAAGTCLPSWPTVPTKAGMKLTGWNTFADGQGQSFNSMMAVNQSQVMYAQWGVAVTFADGSTQQEVIANKDGSLAVQGAIILNPGHTFDGWYKDSNCTAGNKWNFATDRATSNTTLYAKWVLTPTSHSISVGATPAIGGSVAGDGSFNEGSLLSVIATPNAGYHFVKWTENGTHVSADASYSFILGGADRNLVAHFEADVAQCTITFDKNGGDTEATPKTISTTAGTCLPSWPTEPTKAGMKLTGWNTFADGQGQSFNPMMVVNQSQTMYAQWRVAVTFVDGSSQQEVIANADGSVAVRGGIITNPGYTFDGWYKDLNCTAGNKWNFASDRAISNTTLYAKWVQDAPVQEYGTLTGTVTMNGVPVESAVVMVNAPGVQPVNTTADGKYMFSHIPVSDNYTIGAAKPPSAPVTIYNVKVLANQTTNTDISLSATVPPTTHSAILIAMPVGGGTMSGAGTYTENQSVTVTAVANSGYQFLSWSENGAVVSNAASYTFNMGTVDRNLMANFIPVVVPPGGQTGTISGRVMSGPLPVAGALVQVTTGGAITAVSAADGRYSLSNVPVGTNYTVNVSHPAFTAASVSGITVTSGAITANVDFALNAIVIPAQATVTFDSNGGSSGAVPNTKVVPIGSNVSTLPIAPTKNGYTFSGWNTMSNGTGSSFTAATIVNSDIRVYAQWTPVSTNTGSGSSSGGSGGSSGASSASTDVTPVASVKIESTPAGVVQSVGGARFAQATTSVIAQMDQGGKSLATVTEAQITESVNKALAEALKQRVPAKVQIGVQSKVGAKAIETRMPETVFKSLAESKISELTFSTEMATLTFDKGALDGMGKILKGDVRVAIATVDPTGLSEEVKRHVGNRPVYEFNVNSGMQEISRFTGNVIVTVPYALKPGEKANGVIIQYLASNNKLETIRNGIYDSKMGMVRFKTPHLSTYAVGYNEPRFTDVAADAWYGNAVTYVSAREISSGEESGKFGPNVKVTRGEVMMSIMKAYGISPDETTANNFSDAGNKAYSGYLAAAKRLGLTNGIGDNKFMPERVVNRQEMFTMLYGALKSIQALPTNDGGKELSNFKDASKVSPWAVDALNKFSKSGIVGGDGNQVLPTDVVTRAQLAQVIYNLASGNQ